MNNQPVLPRASSRIGQPRKPSVIEAKKIFQNVRTEVSGGPRVSTATASIEQLKDNRGFWERLGGIFVQEETSQQLSNNYVAVKNKFDADYKGVGVEMPKEIIQKFQVGDSLAGSPAFLDDDEVKQLKNLALIAEQKIKFDEELAQKPMIKIEGHLKDAFQGQEPSESVLLNYADSLKKLLLKEKCVPELVVSDLDPRKFVFIFQGTQKNEPPQRVEVNVKTLDDLDFLQKCLEKCAQEAWEAKGVQAEEQASVSIIGKDPFGIEIKDAVAKRQLLEELNKFGVDQRTRWDKFYGFFGGETQHVKQLKLENQTLLLKLNTIFDKTVKGQSFNNAVVNKLPQSLWAKLGSGEQLTENEVKQLQSYTFRAMKEQRFEDDLKRGVPSEITGNLKAEFNGKTPNKVIFDRYLQKLKAELIRGGYPGLVTSDVDPRKFLFFKEGKLITITIKSVKDLDNLEAELKVCRDKALEYAPKVEAIEKVVEGLEKKVEALNSEHKQEIVALARENQKVVAILDEKVAELDKKLGKANDTVNQQEALIRNLQAQLAQQATKLEEEVKNREHLKLENRHLQQDVQDDDRDYKELLETYDVQTKLLDEFTKDNQGLKEELETLKQLGGNIEHQKGIIKDLQAEAQKNAAILEAKTRQSEEMAARVVAQEEKLNEIERNEDAILQRVKDEALTILLLGGIIGATAPEKVKEAGFELNLNEEEEIEQLRVENEDLKRQIRELKVEQQKA